MSKLPLLISVPHAGSIVPEEVGDICRLSEEDIIADGDEGASAIYDIEDVVEAYVTTDVPRAIVDVNRSPDDRRDDGVVKKVTIWNKPVYKAELDEPLVARLIRRYHTPYHQKLTERSSSNVILGIDCHTMTAEAPPIDKKPGKRRPDICISNASGTCPDEWLDILAGILNRNMTSDVSINDPFTGGYIIRSHASELPWMQIEISRRDFADKKKKRELLITSLLELCSELRRITVGRPR